MAVTRVQEPPGPDDPLFNGVWVSYERPSGTDTSDTSESPTPIESPAASGATSSPEILES